MINLGDVGLAVYARGTEPPEARREQEGGAWSDGSRALGWYSHPLPGTPIDRTAQALADAILRAVDPTGHPGAWGYARLVSDAIGDFDWRDGSSSLASDIEAIISAPSVDDASASSQW